MNVSDRCGLTLCDHRRDEHRQTDDPWKMLARACLVEGCPCARFVEPDRLRAEIETVLAAQTRFRRSHTWWVNRLKLALLETAKPPDCRCTLVRVGDTPVGVNWNPDCPVHPWNADLAAQADHAVKLQRQAAQARHLAREAPDNQPDNQP
jgi:hypothetical protein